MRASVARMLVRLYPRQWRERYGEEFEAVLAAGRGDFGTLVNVAVAAMREHILPRYGGAMEDAVTTFGSVTRRPTAWVPLSMSLVALSLVLGAVAWNGGPIHEADEGAVAHLWQILMALQMPLLLWFAVTWLRRAPRVAWKVMVLQAGAVLANVAAVLFLT